MAAYATVDDLVARWRTLEEAEAATASALLDDAAVMIRAVCPDIEDRIADGVIDPLVPLIVSCRMVKRAMQAPAGFEGVSQFNQTAGPFAQATQFANPAGDMWLAKADRKLLGVGGSKAFTVDMWPAYTDEEFATVWGS